MEGEALETGSNNVKWDGESLETETRQWQRSGRKNILNVLNIIIHMITDYHYKKVSPLSRNERYVKDS